LSIFGGSRLSLSAKEMSESVQAVTDAIHAVVPLVKQYTDRYPAFRETGKRMIDAWAQGIEDIKPDAKPGKSSPAPLRERAGLSDETGKDKIRKKNSYKNADGIFSHKAR
jgi:serine/threonine-protein kinase HipA